MPINALNVAGNVLVNVKPIGVGTPMVESLDSYTRRLAAEHRVPRYFVDLLVVGKGVLIDRPKRHHGQICLDTPSKVSSNYARRLSELTATPEVACLGLGSLAGVLSRNNFHRKTRAWCEECLQRWKDEGAVLYTPLLWSLAGYQVCHIHYLPLTMRCEQCLAEYRTKKAWVGPLDVCSACGSALLKVADTKDTAKSDQRDQLEIIPGFQELTAHALADFAEDIQRIPQENLRVGTDFKLLMSHLQQYGLAATQSDIAQVAKVSATTVHELATQKYLPSLLSMLRIAVMFEISLSGLFCPALWGTSASGAKLDAFQVDLPSSQPRKRYEWDEIEGTVMKLIKSGSAKTPYVLAREMGICEKQFCLKLGKTVFRLRQAFNRQNLSIKEQMYLRMKKKVAEAFEYAKKTNRRTSRAALADQLGLPPTSKPFSKAYRDVRQERGGN